MATTILGSTGYITSYIKARVGSDGETQVVEYRGTSSAVGSLYSSLKSSPPANLAELDYDPGRGAAVMRARYLYPATAVTISAGDVQTEYEVCGNDVYRAVETHTSFSSLTADQIKDVRLCVETRPKADGTYVLYDTLSATQQILARLLIKGVSEYLVAGYTLREVRTVTSKKALTVSYSGVGAAVSTSALPAYSANAMIGTLPTGEWLLRAPQIRQLGKSRWTVVREWVYAPKWSSQLYSGTDDP